MPFSFAPCPCLHGYGHGTNDSLPCKQGESPTHLRYAPDSWDALRAAASESTKSLVKFKRKKQKEGYGRTLLFGLIVQKSNNVTSDDNRISKAVISIYHGHIIESPAACRLLKAVQRY